MTTATKEIHHGAAAFKAVSGDAGPVSHWHYMVSDSTGGSLFCFFKQIEGKVMDGILGYAAGAVIAAGFWSLLAPAIEMVDEMGDVAWLPSLRGFLRGGIYIWSIDKILPYLLRACQNRKRRVFKQAGSAQFCWCLQ